MQNVQNQVMPHFSEICHKFGWLRGIQWVVKIITDPFTDLIDFYPYMMIHPREFLDLNCLDRFDEAAVKTVHPSGFKKISIFSNFDNFF